jgi:hypothetical protein
MIPNPEVVISKPNLLFSLGWSGTKSTITEVPKWPILPAPDDD